MFAREPHVTLRGNSTAIYIWPTLLVALVFGLMTYDENNLELTSHFAFIFLLIFTINLAIALIHFRGLWGTLFLMAFIISVLTLALIQTNLNINILSSFKHIVYEFKISSSTYLFIGGALFFLMIFSFIFDHRKGLIVFRSELIYHSLYKGTQHFDTRNIDIRERRTDIFRRFLGFGAGDLEVYVSHGAYREHIELNNVINLQKKLAEWHDLRTGSNTT